MGFDLASRGRGIAIFGSPKAAVETPIETPISRHSFNLWQALRCKQANLCRYFVITTADRGVDRVSLPGFSRVEEVASYRFFSSSRRLRNVLRDLVRKANQRATEDHGVPSFVS